MFDKIGVVYTNIVSIIAVVLGILLVIFSSNTLKFLINRISKQNDILSERMLKGWLDRSERHSHITIIIVGIFLIVIGVLQLIKR